MAKSNQQIAQEAAKKAEAALKKAEKDVKGMREGTTAYAVPPNAVPLLLPHILKDECLILTGTTTDNFTVRMGVSTFGKPK